MDLETAKITLEEMQKALETATPEKRAEIEEEAERIKAEFSHCRQCGEITPEGVWYCNEECQNAYYPGMKTPLKKRMADFARKLHEEELQKQKDRLVVVYGED